MSNDDNPYIKAYEREKRARLEAERQLEDSSRIIYKKNQALEDSYEKLKSQQALMLKQEKLATLGTLSAGVAHEINNPLAFVASNVSTLQSYLQLYQHVQTLLETHYPGETMAPALRSYLETNDFEYINEDAGELLEDTLEGLKRVANIVQSLKNFAYDQPAKRQSADINEGIESTLKLLKLPLEHIEVEKHLAPLPNIDCNPSELNQVILNLLTNAADALDGRSQPKISIKTYLNGSEILITISDNGCGMPESVVSNIFVPFFTTKDVGKGTGMGMSISYGIVESHGGSIEVISEEDKGSEFTIRLPVT